MRRAYLDHAATTALRPSAREAYLEAASLLGNPTSIHASGRRVRAVLDEAVESIAADLGVTPAWVILTSGGTEADNLALRGAREGMRARDARRTAVAVCASDHPAAVETAAAIGAEQLGGDAPGADEGHAGEGIAPGDSRLIGVDGYGRIRDDQLAEALADGRVAVVSAALANNETGICQDIGALSEAAHRAGALAHTDAVQAIGHTDLPGFAELDMMSLTGHKIGAPVGVGALIARPGLPLAAVSTGGGQQRGIRSGTLDAPHAAALAAALHTTLADQDAERARLRGLAARLRAGILAIAPDARLTAAPGVPCADHIVHVLLPGADAQSLLYLLDEGGIDASAGSACSAGVTSLSPVLEAMGIDEQEARGALRLSLGWTSTPEDIDQLLAALPEVLERSRAVGAMSRPTRRAGERTR